MRHLLLTTDFKPRTGGIAEYLHGIGCGLRELGQSVYIVALGLTLPEEFSPPYSIDYVAGADRRLGQRWGDGVGFLRKLNSMRHVFTCRGDAVEALEAAVESVGEGDLRVYIGVWDVVAHWWCRELRNRKIPYDLFAYGQEILRPLGVLRRRWRAEDFRSAETVYTCSSPTAALVKEHFDVAEPIVVHPGIVEPDDELAVETRAEELARTLGIGPRDQVIATVGRLVRRKGVHRVLEVLASEEFRGGNLRYIVAGAGPEDDRLFNLVHELEIEDQVSFLGHVDEETKWAVYALADVFVLANGDLGGRDWEGFGIVFLEAAIMGVPAVGGESGGAVEAIQDGRTGILVEPGSRVELRDALRKLIEDRGLGRRLGEQAQRRVREEFSWKKAAQLLLHG